MAAYKVDFEPRTWSKPAAYGFQPKIDIFNDITDIIRSDVFTGPSSEDNFIAVLLHEMGRQWLHSAFAKCGARSIFRWELARMSMIKWESFATGAYIGRDDNHTYVLTFDDNNVFVKLENGGEVFSFSKAHYYISGMKRH